MNRDEGLHRAVIDAPDDDGPRLVYADWFDEHGEPERAEFIRTQIALARSPADDPRRPEWQQREADLLGRHGWEWAAHLGFRVQAWEFRRGFIERVEMELEKDRDEIVAVLREEPIRHLRGTDQFCDLTGVVNALPDLAGLTGLEFWYLYAFEDDLLRVILTSPHLANLQTLILHHDRNGNLADEAVIAEGLRSPYRSRLTELAVNVDGTWRGPAGEVLRAMADSSYLRNLRKLNLSNAGDPGNEPGMDAGTARMLGASPNLAGLEELDLGRTRFPAEVWDEVLRWPCLPRLRRLRLHYACVVNPPDWTHAGVIADRPEYREAFEAAVREIDWTTECITPWDGNAGWTGQSWSGLQEAHAFAMWPFVRDGDFDGLEAASRADCVRHAGEEAAAAIDALPFAGYEAELEPGLRAIIATADRPDAAAVSLRVRTDLGWQGRYHVYDRAEAEPFTPQMTPAYPSPLVELPAPSFPEAGEVKEQLGRANPLDPNSASHYLVARTVAAFGRCVARVRPRWPVYVACNALLLRVWPWSSR